MKYLFTLIFITMTLTNHLTAQTFDITKIKNLELQLEDVMELMDTTELKVKLKEAEQRILVEHDEISKLRLGILYHEAALNLSLLSKTTHKGYAQKSYDLLTELYTATETTLTSMPFIAAYRASALALVSAETRQLKLLSKAFILFNEAVINYSTISYLPEFLRGSVAENLPWFFFSKRRVAKNDFESIIEKQTENSAYANWKIMSFTYWAWANQHRGRKFRVKSLHYLDLAIKLDPDYKAGRKKAEELRNKLN